MPANSNSRVVEVGGITKTLTVGNLYYTSPDINPTRGVMSPYTNLIPLQYLEKMEFNLPESATSQVIGIGNLRDIFGARQVDLSRFPEAQIITNKQKSMEKKGTALLYRLLGVPAIFDKNSAYSYLESYLGMGIPQGFTSSIEMISNNTKAMHDVFGKWRISSYTLRSCNGTVGNFHISTTSPDGTETAYQILPVILPQNLYYQRLHLFLHGSIDLAYVIFLVNEELEKDSFPIKGLRTMYMGRLKKILLDTAGQVMLVPGDFIRENCFVPPFKLAGRKPAQRAMEKDSIVRMFLAGIQTGNYDLDWSMYYDPTKDVPSPEPYTGPLVPPVDSTSMVDDRMKELMPQGAARSPIVPVTGDLVPTALQRLFGAATELGSLRAEMVGVTTSVADIGPAERRLHPMDDIEGGQPDDDLDSDLSERSEGAEEEEDNVVYSDPGHDEYDDDRF